MSSVTNYQKELLTTSRECPDVCEAVPSSSGFEASDHFPPFSLRHRSTATMIARRALLLASRSTLAARSLTPLGARSVHVEASKDSIQAAIKSEKVLVFSKTHCPYCARVKALFKDLQISHEVVELDERKDGADIQALLLELTKQRTVPNVFIKGQHIGGCDSTLELHAQNKLVALAK